MNETTGYLRIFAVLAAVAAIIVLNGPPALSAEGASGTAATGSVPPSTSQPVQDGDDEDGEEQPPLNPVPVEQLSNSSTASDNSAVLQPAVPDNSPAIPCPFEVGEKVTYTVTYAGIPAGTVVMETHPLVEINDKTAFRITITATSYKAFDSIYHVSNEVETMLDNRTYLPYFYRKKIEQGDRKRFEHIEFDRDNGTAVAYNAKDKGKLEKKGEYKIAPKAQDPLSCYFYFRTMKLEVGKDIQIPVFTGKNNFNIQVKVLAKETKKIRGVGQWMTYHVVPEYSFEGIFIHKGKVDMWIEEQTKIPVLMEFQLPIGFVTVQLSNVEYASDRKDADSKKKDK
jgi:hypothetical protein